MSEREKQLAKLVEQEKVLVQSFIVSLGENKFKDFLLKVRSDHKMIVNDYGGYCGNCRCLGRRSRGPSVKLKVVRTRRKGKGRTLRRRSLKRSLIVKTSGEQRRLTSTLWTLCLFCDHETRDDI